MSAVLRAGVIGAGAIAVHGHVPGYRAAPDVEVVAICDLKEDRVKSVADDLAIPHAYTDYHEMLAQESLDLVSVCVPNVFHRPMTLAALEAGAHVLCEKPMALTFADACAMVEASRQAGRTLTVGHHMRFMPAVMAAKSALSTGALGELYYAKVSYLRRSGIPGYGSWFTNKDLAGGGAMLDIGCHILDLALYLLGHPKPVAVSAATFAKFGPRAKGLGGWGADHFGAGARFDVDDLTTAFVRFDTGLILTVEASWASHGTDGQRVQIFGTEGGVELNDRWFGKEAPLHYFGEEDGQLTEQPVALPEVGGASSYDREIAAWVEGIRVGRPPLVTAEQAAMVVQVIEGVYKSAECGAEVVL